MFKALAASVATAIALAGATTVPQLTGTADVSVSAPPTALQDHHLAARVLQSNCAQSAWPYYDHQCLRNQTQFDDRLPQPRQVRIVTTDRRQ